MRFLRAHCDWDARQTPRSLVRHLLEEAHEVADAIEAGSADRTRDELGDLLLNLAFQVVIGEEDGDFDADAVTRGLEEKMIRRHPHLFQDGGTASWDAVKRHEEESERTLGAGAAEHASPLRDAVAAQRVAARLGFDWPEPGPALEKVREEAGELEEALALKDAEERVRAEIGDLLFAAVNVARLSGVDPSAALSGTTRRFRDRFRRMVERARERGLEPETAGLTSLDRIWDEIKAEEAET